MSVRDELLQAPLSALCARLSLPVVAGLLLIGAATFADAAFVGHYATTDALGGILLGFPVTMLNSAVAGLIGSGCAAVLSRAIGASDAQKARRVCGAFVVWTVVASLLVTGAVLLWAEPMLGWLGATGAMLSEGALYLRIVFAGAVVQNFVFGASFLIRGEGRMSGAMALLGGGSVLNVLLDGVLVAGMSMGAEGAAYATLFTQVATGLATALFLWRDDGALSMRRWRLTMAPSLAREVLRDGAAAMLMYGMAMLQQAIAFRVVASHGTSSAVVFMGAYLRLIMLGMIPMWAIAMAVQPLVGVCHGAGLHQRVGRAVSVFARYATLIGVLVGSVALVAPRAVLGLLLTDTQVIGQHVHAFRWLMAPFPLLAAQLVIASALVSIGKGAHASVLLVARNLVLLLPAVLILPRILGIEGVWLAFVVTEVLSFGIAIVFWRKLR